MVRKVPRELIEVNVEYPEGLSKLSVGKILTDLVKNLLHQRNQIPLQYDAIAKDVLGGIKENQDPQEVIGASSRESVKISKQAARAAKNRTIYLKNGSKLVEEVEQLIGLILRELEKNDLVSVSFLFGATPLSPREVYTVFIPDTVGHLKTNSRLGVHMFRAMVTHNMLHSLTSTKIPVSNMFTLFCRRSICDTPSLHMLSNYSLPPITRCPRVNFTLNTPLIEEPAFLEPVIASRRLRFHSGATGLDIAQGTPAKPINEEITESVGRTSRKVEQMELCTPQVVRYTGPRRTQITPQICTPYLTTELCTPALRSIDNNTVQGEMDLCTPAVDLRTKFKEGMSLCTPAVGMKTRVSDSMELCTPAVSLGRTLNSDSMELCTPAVNMRSNNCDYMDLCTPAAGMKTEDGDAMYVGTPTAKTRTRESDFLDVERELQVEPGKDLVSDLKPEMKDSGISSPDSSRRDCQEELFWFVTQVPVRGFKC